MYTPYLPAQAGSPQESASSGGASSSSSPEKISGTMKAEIVNLLKQNGMPSDVEVLLQNADTFLSKSRNLSRYTIFGGTDEDYTLSDLIKIQQLVNDVKYNDGLRNEAVKQITAENAGSEVAISSNGKMYVMTEEGIKRIDPEDYDRSKHQALTNDQLLYYREQNPGLAFDTSILNDLQNAIGMKSITDYLRTTIKAFGTNEYGGYTTTNDAISKGIAWLNEQGPDGFYKFKTKDQVRDVYEAIDFLFEGLTTNAKKLLTAKTAADGGNPNSKTDVRKLILQALELYPDKTVDLTFDKSATDFDPYQTGKKGGSTTEQLTQNNYLQQIGNKRLYKTHAAIVPMASQV